MKKISLFIILFAFASMPFMAKANTIPAALNGMINSVLNVQSSENKCPPPPAHTKATFCACYANVAVAGCIAAHIVPARDCNMGFIIGRMKGHVDMICIAQCAGNSDCVQDCETDTNAYINLNCQPQ